MAKKKKNNTKKIKKRFFKSKKVRKIKKSKKILKKNPKKKKSSKTAKKKKVKKNNKLKKKKVLKKKIKNKPSLNVILREKNKENLRKLRIKKSIFFEKAKIKSIKQEIAILEKIIVLDQRFENFLKGTKEQIKEYIRQLQIRIIIFFEKLRVKKTKQDILKLDRLIKQEQRLQEKKIRDKENLRNQLLKDIKRVEREKIYKLKDHLWKIGDRFSVIRERYKAYRASVREKQLAELEIRRQSREEARAILEAQKAENALKQKLVERLERFSRNMKSIVFQINKRYISKKRAQLRFIDNIAENGECLIKNDDAPTDKDYLILLYVEGDSVEQRLENPICLDDKTDLANTKNYQPKDIFEASDYIIDRLALMFDKERKLKK